MKSNRLGATLLAVGTFVFLRSYTSGPSTGYTGAPSESTCTSCHSGSAISSGTQWNRIRLKTNFTGGGYIPDSTYTFTLSHVESGISTFGFQLTVLDSQYKAAGTFNNTNNRTQTSSGSVGGNTRYYVNHTNTGSSRVATDSTAWTFQWKAPSKNLGGLTLYVSVNAANSNGGSSGDRIYTKTFSLSPSSALPVVSAKLNDTVACSAGFKMAGTASNQATSYLWEQVLSATSTKTLSTQQNPSLQLAAGTYTLRFTARNAKGPSLPFDTKITVNPSPNKPSTSPKGNQEICEGSQLRLSTLKVNTSGYTQKWLPGGQTATLIYVSDSGTYYHEVTSDMGCKTLSDPVRLSINPLPVAQAQWLDSPAVFCQGQSAEIRVQLELGDSILISGGNGTFSTDSILWAPINTGNNAVNLVAKSTKGCLSKTLVLKAQGVDTVKSAVLAGIDSSLTELTFRWMKSPEISEWFISQDSGKTWISNSSDTSFTWTLGQGNKTVLLGIKGRDYGPCIWNQSTFVQGTTQSCKPIPYSWSWLKKPICVGDSAHLALNDLPTSYSVLWDGNPEGQQSEWRFAVQQQKWSVKISVLDSQQLICGSSDRRIELSLSSLDSKSLSLDMLDSSRSCTNELLVQYSTLTDSVSTVWAVFGSQTYSLKLGQNQSAVLSHQSSPLLWLEATNAQGCKAQSKPISLLYPQKPNAQATWTFQNDSIQFFALDPAQNHLWYMGLTAGNWMDSSQNAQPTWSIKDWPGEKVAFSHRASNDGFGCATQWDSVALLPVNRMKRAFIQTPVLSPNPVVAGQALNIPKGWSATTWTNAMGQSIESVSNNAQIAPLTPGIYYLTLNKRDHSVILPVIVLEP